MVCVFIPGWNARRFFLNKMEMKMATTARGHRSLMMHQFAQVPRAEIPRSTFDRSHGLKTTFNEAMLVPIFVDEVLPGDTFALRATLFGRLATPIFPIMDNLYLETFFFFVPYRLVWSHFVNFFGEQANPTDTTSYLVPTLTSPAGGYAENSLFDYMGLPTKVAGIVHSALPFRAYNLIFNQWFRDENLITSVPVIMSDGPDTVNSYSVLYRGKRHDYFTSCLPFPQKGPAVQVPLGSTAPVTRVASAPAWNVYLSGTQTGPGANIGGGTNSAGSVLGQPSSGNAWSLDPMGGLIANLSTATAATINQLRQAFQIQKIYERDARGGTRYTELIRAHFGVTSPDARLQRPEYLGGGSMAFNVNPIAQTSGSPTTVGGPSTGNTPQGHLAAMGTLSAQGHGFTKSFTEHGVIIGLVNMRADLNYQDGLDRMWSRSTRFDFYWPALSMIGEQSVLNQEIYAQGTAGGTADTGVFGYQERYAEYRYKPSRVCGQFRSNAATPLDTWHLAQHFSALPVLGPAFITDNPPVSRVVAVPSEPRVLLDVFFQFKCARPMPVYSVPGLIDHF